MDNGSQPKRLQDTLLLSNYSVRRVIHDLKNLCKDKGVVNLNDAAEQFRVHKRRLFEIGDALVGLHYFERVGNYGIQLKVNTEKTRAAIKTEIEELEANESELDELIDEVTNALNMVKHEKTDGEYYYLNFDEFKNVPALNKNTILVVKSPKDSVSSIDVSNPIETGRCKVTFRNQNLKPLRAYFVKPKLEEVVELTKNLNNQENETNEKIKFNKTSECNECSPSNENVTVNCSDDISSSSTVTSVQQQSDVLSPECSDLESSKPPSTLNDSFSCHSSP